MSKQEIYSWFLLDWWVIFPVRRKIWVFIQQMYSDSGIN